MAATKKNLVVTQYKDNPGRYHQNRPGSDPYSEAAGDVLNSLTKKEVEDLDRAGHTVVRIDFDDRQEFGALVSEVPVSWGDLGVIVRIYQARVTVNGQPQTKATRTNQTPSVDLDGAIARATKPARSEFLDFVTGRR